MPVPFADLHLQYQTTKSEIDEAIATEIRDSSSIRGPHVDRFEREFAEAAEAKHCVSCANSTDAIWLVLKALNVEPDDEVITTDGVQTAVHYPTALPLLPAYERFQHRPEQFPNAVRDQRQILSLPMFAEITRTQQDEVIDLVCRF